MKKIILKDKLPYPIGFTLVYFFLRIKGCESFYLLTLTSFLIFIVIYAFTFLRSDNYVRSVNFDKKSIEFIYQKNFAAGNLINFKLDLSTLKSFKFRSKAFLEFSNFVSIKFLNDDNLFETIELKTDNDEIFIEILKNLNEAKKN